MKLSDKQFLFAKNINLLELWMINQGYKFTYGEAWRPDEMQKIYYDKKLSKVKTRGSHGKRLARDYNIFIDEEWVQDRNKLKPIGEFWKSLNPNNRWGGDWTGFGKDGKGSDPGHFERLEYL